ncbi:MAG: hypothetical protein RR420_01045 [Anaerovoracaceae bacterium]
MKLFVDVIMFISIWAFIIVAILIASDVVCMNKDAQISICITVALLCGRVGFLNANK